MGYGPLLQTAKIAQTLWGLLCLNGEESIHWFSPEDIREFASQSGHALKSTIAVTSADGYLSIDHFVVEDLAENNIDSRP